jgi:hypothetical protein
MFNIFNIFAKFSACLATFFNILWCSVAFLSALRDAASVSLSPLQQLAEVLLPRRGPLS